jgi:FKBP-type peptidyl-prolyl cis-trans isomerase FkpA
MNRFVTRALAAALTGCALSGAYSVPAVAQNPNAADAAPKPVPPPKTMTDEQKTLYQLGVLLSRNLDGFALNDAEFAAVRQGFADGFHRKVGTEDAAKAIPQIQSFQRDRSQKVGDAYLTKASQAPGATRTTSGLVFVPVKQGTGASPARADSVKVTYEGRLIDGTVFDSSAQHGGSATFGLSGVIACWTEALQLMKVGGKAHIVCPAAIAYGQRAMGSKIAPGSTLVFDIELLDVIPAPAPGPAPAAPAAGSSSGAGHT